LRVCRAEKVLRGPAPPADETLLAERFGTMAAQA
jgi:hypothetical protein